MNQFKPVDPTLSRSLTSPEPIKSNLEVTLADGATVEIQDDPYSNRIRCDHPDTSSASELADTLLMLARKKKRGRVMLMAPEELGDELLERQHFVEEARIPNFYKGKHDCAIISAFSSPTRAQLANPAQVKRVLDILEQSPEPRIHPPVRTERATAEDASQIAALIGATFEEYPTPSSDPDYIQEDILSGTPYRVVRHDDEVVACASADLVPEARSAELTDCATRPDFRGRGMMGALLSGLIEDLKKISYDSAFTLARANQVGMNLVFQRLGFELHGTMAQSCRIGAGIEDMNVWSAELT